MWTSLILLKLKSTIFSAGQSFIIVFDKYLHPFKLRFYSSLNYLRRFYSSKSFTDVWLKSSTFIFLESAISIFVSYLHPFKLSYYRSWSYLMISANFPVMGEALKLRILIFWHFTSWTMDKNLHPLKLSYSNA
jgi:hypothetical protein